MAIPSDPSQLVIRTHQEKEKGAKQFKFEEKWIESSEYTEIIEKLWQEPQATVSIGRSTIPQKLKHYRHNLTRWSRERFGNTRAQIRETQERIREL